MIGTRKLTVPLALLLGTSGATLSFASAQFTEVAVEVGVSAWPIPDDCAALDCGLTADQLSSLRTQSGFAVGDLDGDGHDDIFVPRFANGPLMFINRGDGTFARRTIGTGLEGTQNLGAAVVFDVDGDGDLDVFATGHLQANHVLYLNRLERGSLRFEESALARGLASPLEAFHSGSAVAVGDPDLDGDLDLYVSEWDRRRTFECAGEQGGYYRNLGPSRPGFFERVTSEVGLNVVRGDQINEYSFEPVFADFDSDGWPDLWLSGDFGTSALFWNERGRFQHTRPVMPGMSDMGAALADFDGDQRVDLFVTAIDKPSSGYDGNRLYLNQGARHFTEAVDTAGVRDAGWAWGTEPVDIDLDGDVDLLVVSGFFADGPEPLRVFENDDAVFSQTSYPEGLPGSVGQGRGVLAQDIDEDGDLDLIVSYMADRIRIFRNDLPSGPHWLRVRLRDQFGGLGYGARVTVTDTTGRVQIRELGARGGYTASATPEAHFGFGVLPDPSLQVTVRFLGGLEVSTTVDANQRIVLEEPSEPRPLGAALPVLQQEWDCDLDGLANVCAADCDASGVADGCEIVAQPSLDCDRSGVLDSCELALGLISDCDDSGMPDACEIDAESDCDGNLVLDACEADVVCTPSPADGGSAPDGGAGDQGVNVRPRGGVGCAAGDGHAGTSMPWIGVLVLCVSQGRRRRERRRPARVSA